MMTEVGDSAFIEDEAERLREYLKKGGFLWADDFWGAYAWDWWEAQIRKVLPATEYQIIDLPLNHPLFRSQFEIKSGRRRRSPRSANGFSGGGTSERGATAPWSHGARSLDKHGRIMVLMTHNTDLGDSFEREAEDPTYFYQMSVPGYAFGINTLLYALTH